MTSYVLSRCEQEVVSQEIWLPLVGIQVDHEIAMGQVVIKPVPKTSWQRWVSEWNARLPVEVARIKRFIADLGTGNLTVTVLRTTAEPIKAVEIALEVDFHLY